MTHPHRPAGEHQLRSGEQTRGKMNIFDNPNADELVRMLRRENEP